MRIVSAVKADDIVSWSSIQMRPRKRPFRVFLGGDVDGDAAHLAENSRRTKVKRNTCAENPDRGSPSAQAQGQDFMIKRAQFASMRLPRRPWWAR